jgi:uroporphyrin-III C-methyltransferase/precorrin-2 dehydrogenase/sirohydrochlorin ferrochelatase
VLARLLRQRIEAMLPPSLGRLALLADSFNGPLRQRVPDPAARRPLLEAAIGGPAADLLLAGRDEDARDAFARALEGAAVGGVWLVGVGSGETDLLTLRAHRAMGEADVLLYNPDIAPPLLAMARRDATAALAGADAVDRAATLAQRGKRVARLALGNGSALDGEAAALAAAGVIVHRVTGVG